MEGDFMRLSTVDRVNSLRSCAVEDGARTASVFSFAPTVREDGTFGYFRSEEPSWRDTLRPSDSPTDLFPIQQQCSVATGREFSLLALRSEENCFVTIQNLLSGSPTSVVSRG